MAHLEGPWGIYIGEGRDAIAISKWIDGPNGGKMGLSLAKMPMPSKYLSQEQINDNAKVMKAAPDMLAALKSWIEPWSGYSDETMRNRVELSSDERFRDEAALVLTTRAALAKAEA